MQIPGFLYTLPAKKMGYRKGCSVGSQRGSAGPCSSQKGLAGTHVLILLLAAGPAWPGGPQGATAPAG